MQLDKTSIAIANRDLRDTLDLSLMVVRHYFKGILLYSVIGLLPFALLNFFLTLPLTRYDELEYSSSSAIAQLWHWQRYYVVMACAVFLQAPLAFSFLTSFIGQAVFQEVQTPRQVFGSIAKCFWRLFFVLGVIRCGVISLLMLWTIYNNPQFDFFRDSFLYLIVICGISYLVRCLRPFAPEILILEGCPLRVSKANSSHQLSYRRRSTLLYGADVSDTTKGQFELTFVSLLMVLILCMGCVFCLGVLFGIWRWGPWIDCIVYPIMLWSVSAWMTVVRFLSYVNARIRIEGWELQLKLRAEAIRLKEASA